LKGSGEGRKGRMREKERGNRRAEEKEEREG
jgi:hypothetical protein